MWTVWSLENDLVTRRLHVEMESQRLFLDPQLEIGTRSSLSDHEVFYLGPGGLFSRSWDRDWGPEAI